jgi:hypothetical protein
MSVHLEVHTYQRQGSLSALGIVALLSAAALSLLFVFATRGPAPVARSHDLDRPAASMVGRSLPTSFGAVAVEAVRTIPADSSLSLGNADPVQDLALQDKMQVHVSATLSNLSDQPVSYAHKQFRLVIQDSGETLLPLRSSIADGELQPQASIDDEMDFLVPRDASELSVKFVEFGTSKPVLMDLGRLAPPIGDTRSPPGL